MNDFSLSLVLPTVSLAAFGLLSLIFVPMLRGMGRLHGTIGLFGIGLTAYLAYGVWRTIIQFGPQSTAAGLVRVDPFGLYLTFVVLLIGGLTVLYSTTFLEREGADEGLFHPLVLFGMTGALVALHTKHVMLILLGLELFSLALYALIGLTRSRSRSLEGAMKAFLLGAFSTAFVAFGAALLYGAVGSLDLTRIGRAAGADPGPLLWIGAGLVLVGLAFKLAIVPFHQWAPDAYQGAPTNVTGFMAASTATVGIAVLLRFLLGAFGYLNHVWVPLVTGLAILTMTVANLIALTQTNVKRLLAYGSIGHVGFLMIAIVCRPSSGVAAIAFYLTAFALMTVGAFAVLAVTGRGDAEREAGHELHDWAGLGWRRPLPAAAMALLLVSLAGLPPTAGFFAKLVVVRAAIESDAWLLAIVGMLNAVVAAYAFLRVVVTMYMREPERDEPSGAVSLPGAAVLIVTILGVVALGTVPGRLLDLVRNLSSSLL